MQKNQKYAIIDIVNVSYHRNWYVYSLYIWHIITYYSYACIAQVAVDI